MKKLIFFLSLAAFSQGYVFNPFTNNFDKVGSSGGGSGAAPYTATVTAQTTLTVTAATHGQGTTPLPQPCLDGASSPRTGATCAFTVADNGDVVYTWSPAFTGKVVIGGGGAGSGTGDVVGPASSTDNAIARYDSTTGKLLQNSAVTIDDSGNIVTAGSITSGSGGGSAGYIELGQGTAPTAGTTSVKLYGGSAITSYIMQVPSAAGTGFILGTNTAGDVVQTFVPFTGTGDVVRATSPTLVTPALGTPSALVATNATGTAAGLTAGAATALATARAIYGNNFDGSAALTQVIASTYGGTGNGFTKFTGPTTAEKEFTLPDASATLTQTIASGTKALDTDAITSGSCDTLATTTATGAASTDVIMFTANADITGVTGYAPVTTGGLAIYAWPTTNTINWKVCNPTSSSITPGAVTLNYRVVR